MPGMTGDQGDAARLAELAELPEMNPGPVLRLNGDGEILLANAAAKGLFGASIKGQRWIDLDVGLPRGAWEEIREGTESFRFESRVEDAWLSFTYVPSRRTGSVFVFGADITALKEAEQQVAEMARFPDINPGPVVRLDFAGTVVLANRAARAVFGDDVRGRCWRDVCPLVDDERWSVILDSDLFTHETQVGERTFLITYRKDSLGELLFVYGTDITDQRRVEHALRRSERMATLGTLAAGVAHELNNPAAATQRAAEQLREAFERFEAANLRLAELGIDAAGCAALRTLADRIHSASAKPDAMDPVDRADLEAEVEEWLGDLGASEPWETAPALVAQGFDVSSLQELSAGMDQSLVPLVVNWAATAYPVGSLANVIGQATARISEIVGALKSYSYLGEAPAKEIDLHEGIENTLVILASKLKRGVTVRRDYDTDLPHVQAHGGELNQVWTNLIHNAIDAMDGKGEIEITTRSDGDWAVVEVQDTGPGISEEILPNIFDAFYTTKQPGRGTGLGLSTSYSIIADKHKGSIVASTNERGARFVVHLPLAGSKQTTDVPQ